VQAWLLAVWQVPQDTATHLLFVHFSAPPHWLSEVQHPETAVQAWLLAVWQVEQDSSTHLLFVHFCVPPHWLSEVQHPETATHWLFSAFSQVPQVKSTHLPQSPSVTSFCVPGQEVVFGEYPAEHIGPTQRTQPQESVSLV